MHLELVSECFTNTSSNASSTHLQVLLEHPFNELLYMLGYGIKFQNGILARFFMIRLGNVGIVVPGKGPMVNAPL
jgi:hypothetical protein